MKREINKKEYCTHSYNNPSNCKVVNCIFRHRKWPTLEQFKEEYSENYPDDGAVWIFIVDKWELHELKSYYNYPSFVSCPIVCACTPCGKPPNDWKPK